MRFDRAERLAVLRGRASDYLDVAVANAVREFPVASLVVADRPGPYPSQRERHPAFYGAFDWHSCVEMHWVVVRLLHLFPTLAGGPAARLAIDGLLTSAHIAREVATFSLPSHRGFERPYGWGWLLKLQAELCGWDDPDARRWGDALRPLSDLIVDRLIAWLPSLTYAQRVGTHPNTAFALSLSLDWSEHLRREGDRRLLDGIRHASERLFRLDEDYPAHYEPSGADFLSPALTEAELMSRLLDPDGYPAWIAAFLPGLERGEPRSLFTTAIVSDATDGQIAHLHGLNLSRAWAMAAIAERVPSAATAHLLLVTADEHAAASLPHVVGSDYMVEHWLAAYAVLLLG